MDSVIYGFLAALLVALIAAYVRYLLAKSHTTETFQKNREQDACDKYHSAIHHVLEGIYPNTDNWKDDIGDRLRKSIPKIELTVTELKRFIKRKADIDTTLKNYKDCCHEITYSNVQAYIIYGKEKGDTDPREIFKTKVDALLEFAKRP